MPCAYASDGANGSLSELTGQCLVATVVCMSDDLGHDTIVWAAVAEASPYGNLQKFYKNFLACTYEHTLANLLYMQIPVLVVYYCGAIEHTVILEPQCMLQPHHLFVKHGTIQAEGAVPYGKPNHICYC